MPDAEAVVDALGAGGKRREAAALLDAAEPPAAAGEHLVRIGLMPDVPNQAVVRRVEHEMERDSQLDRAETGCQVAAHLADGFDEVAAQLVGQRAQLAAGEGPEVGGRLDRGEQAVRLFVTHGRSLLERRLATREAATFSLAAPLDQVARELAQGCSLGAE